MKKQSVTRRRAAGRTYADNLLMRVLEETAKLRSGSDSDAPGWASLLAKSAEESALTPLPGREAGKDGVTGEEVKQVVQFLGASMLLRLAEGMRLPVKPKARQ